MSSVCMSLLCAGIVRCGLSLMLAGASGSLRGETVALSDADMAQIHGRDGIGFAVHLEMNSAVLQGVELDSRLVSGFNVNGTTTYLVAQNPGGIIDMVAMTLHVRQRPNGGDYIDLGLPFFVGVSEFGYRALGVQADPIAPIVHSEGQLLLNGHAAMQGHLYLWAQ